MKHKIEHFGGFCRLFRRQRARSRPPSRSKVSVSAALRRQGASGGWETAVGVRKAQISRFAAALSNSPAAWRLQARALAAPATARGRQAVPEAPGGWERALDLRKVRIFHFGEALSCFPAAKKGHFRTTL